MSEVERVLRELARLTKRLQAARQPKMPNPPAALPGAEHPPATGLKRPPERRIT